MVRTIRKLKRKTARIIVKHRMCRNGKLTIARDKIRRKRMSCFLLTLAVLLLIIPGFIMLRHKFATLSVDNELTEQNQELYSTATIIYRHLHAYPTYCRKNEYTMLYYPKVFFNTYNSDLTTFGQAARRQGKTPDLIIAQIQNGFSSIIEKSIRKEFSRLRRRGLKQKDNQPVQSDEEICRYIDENAAMWFETEKKADIERMQEFAKSYQTH